MRDSEYPQVAYERNGKQLVNEPSPTNDPDPQLVLKKGKTYPPQFFGISSRVFAIISILIFLVVGAAIGGGVGGGISTQHCNSKLNALHEPVENGAAQDPTTITVTAEPTSTAANTEATGTPIPSTGCDKDPSFSTTYTTAVGFTFTKTCNRQYIGSDIAGVVVGSWDLCMEACGTPNNFNVTKGGFTCVGLTFVPSFVVKSYATGNVSMWSNCFLQHAVADLDHAPNTRNFEIVVSTMKR